MFNYYLYNDSYENASVNDIELNLKTLNEIAVGEKREYDSFLMHQSLWETKTSVGSFSDAVFSQLTDQQFSRQVIPKLFQSINGIDSPLTSLEEFDQVYRIYNGFYGIEFGVAVNDRHISNKERYQEFHDRCLKTIGTALLWKHRTAILKKVILCPQIEEHLKKVGGAYTVQILSRLLDLDCYVSDNWIDGEFNYRDLSMKTSLNVSPESKQTMGQKKHRDERTFQMPDGSTECFDLHIKTGDLRVYFLPKGREVFIGYIGSHLPTASFK